MHPFQQHVCEPLQAGPPLHVALQDEFTQLDPYGQEYPQPPQLYGSLVMSEHPDPQHVCDP